MGSTSTEPYGHNVVSLLGIVLVASVVGIGLVAYACTTLVGLVRARRDATAATPWAVGPRAAASLAAAGALAVYAWGAFHLLRYDDTEWAPACRAAEGPVDVTAVESYSATYVPLRFGCHTADGTTYAVGVPEYVNPAALTLALTAGVLAGAAALASRSARRPPAPGTAPGY
ncbi:hypothetical protein GPA10_17870 [Streptomyces sp. p1417]|uniref:Uncharacterized protein n=1 Tax=Streptomyces typhae TaxID=2681492 RepID=A0A6L6WYJ0_9ACTN|nr:hypothetical protein [Streptomyces typhae]MVO86579.1 hypothetical protein [Streptomyces typhae]